MNLKIDSETHTVLQNTKERHLPKKEFEILNLLCSVPGNVFSRETIFKNVWTEKSSSKERTVDVHILNIRKKFGEDVIKTIKGVGYKCKCE